MAYVFEPAPQPHALIKGTTDLFAVNRIHCVAKNYGEHIREMGGDPQKTKPKFFSKSSANLIVGSSEIRLDYPLQTKSFHFELELVVALGPEAKIFGYGIGIDFTKRDVQLAAKNDGMPWDTSKNFYGCATLGEIVAVSNQEVWTKGRIKLSQNSEVRQDGDLSEMIYGVADILDHLDGYDPLRAGDLIYTGTPAGVGAVHPGDELLCEIDGLDPIKVIINP